MEWQSYCNDDKCMSSPIEVDEILNICQNLKRKKAPGWDGVTSEHVQHGGKCLIKCLSWLFNCIKQYECIPDYFKIGIIVPIPKGNKDQLFQDNHRGITLIPMLAKIFEKCILKRVEKSRIIKCVIDELQGVSTEKCSSLHTAWLLKEVISCHIEKGNTVYVGMLDIKKAYDTVWQDGMLYKLFEYGINGKTWRLIKNFYRNFSCCVHFGSLSDVFVALQGIHQGAPCSTLLFALFENELIKLLKELKCAPTICNINVSCPTFADDISLVSMSKHNMQTMFKIAYNYSCKWRFQFSPEKCKIIIFGKDHSPLYNVKLGNHVITVSNSETHLGVGLTVSNKAENEYVNKKSALVNLYYMPAKV